MLTLSNLQKNYGEKTVIAGLTHTFQKSGAVALMGPSGCGKTTLLRLVAGLEKPSGGAVETNDARISYAFQEPRLLPTLTCRENVALVLEKGKDPAVVDELLETMELQEAACQLPAALSGGMRQRVSLARALAYGGDILLLDEPFSALDERLKQKVAAAVLRYAENSLLLAVTHDEQDAALLHATVLHCTGSPFSALQ